MGTQALDWLHQDTTDKPYEGGPKTKDFFGKTKLKDRRVRWTDHTQKNNKDYNKNLLSSSAQERIQHVHQSKENYNEEGQDILDNIIMVLAENKYKSIVRVGEWNAPSKEQKRF